MASLWHEADAAKAAENWADAWGADFAPLIYVSRLLGADPALVSHGGGNTSLEREETDLFGDRRRVLRVKASGFDLRTIGPEGFTALDAAKLRRLADRDRLEDEALADCLRAARLDGEAPFPSVEALLHAFVPAPVVLHAHAEAVLVLADQPSANPLIEAIGERFAVIDYAMPGLALARAVLEATRNRPELEGVAVRHHGIFTWAETARQAYELMIEAVQSCREAAGRRVLGGLGAPGSSPAPAEVGPAAAGENASARMASLAPVLRGLLTPAGDDPGGLRRPVLVFRTGPELLWLLSLPGAEEIACRGVLTPDHVIHTGFCPLVLDPATLPAEGAASPARPEAASALRRSADGVLAGWRQRYDAYVTRHGGGTGIAGYDPRPRVILVPGWGLFGVGRSRSEALGAAQLAERSLAVRAQAESVGRFEPPQEADVFEMEFWPPEQAKRHRHRPLPLDGRVALVTGAAGAIGAGIAVALARAGAAVVMSDLAPGGDARRLQRAADRVREAAGPAQVVAIPFDVTSPESVQQAMDRACLACGGVDLAVLSHGLAEVDQIDALDPRRLETVFSVNALGAFHVLGAFVRQLRAQGRGGDVILISTKNVPDPGASFSAYSASKAAAHQLARVAALELAGDDIRVNLVSPDAVFGDEEIPSKLWEYVGGKRARSKGLDPRSLPEHYRQRNLLKTAVTVSDVAEAVLFFAERRTPTTGAVIPVDGGLPGAFPR